MGGGWFWTPWLEVQFEGRASARPMAEWQPAGGRLTLVEIMHGCRIVALRDLPILEDEFIV